MENFEFLQNSKLRLNFSVWTFNILSIIFVTDIMVGGKNFGCGSSREHAPVAIKASGIPVIIAADFARIFYRNGINIGLPLLEIGDDVEKIHADDELRVDTETGRIENLTTGDVFQAHPLPGFVQKIAEAGGLINYIKEKGAL